MHCYLHLVLPSLSVLDVGILILVHQQVRCRSQSPWDLELIGTCMGLGQGVLGLRVEQAKSFHSKQNHFIKIFVGAKIIHTATHLILNTLSASRPNSHWLRLRHTHTLSEARGRNFAAGPSGWQRRLCEESGEASLSWNMKCHMLHSFIQRKKRENVPFTLLLKRYTDSHRYKYLNVILNVRCAYM